MSSCKRHILAKRVLKVVILPALFTTRIPSAVDSKVACCSDNDCFRSSSARLCSVTSRATHTMASGSPIWSRRTDLVKLRVRGIALLRLEVHFEIPNHSSLDKRLEQHREGDVVGHAARRTCAKQGPVRRTLTKLHVALIDQSDRSISGPGQSVHRALCR